MTVTEFLSKQESSQKELLTAIHELIISTNKKVVAQVAPMMGKEMIIYTSNGVFVYGLASNKSHMSLHLMPIYGSHELHSKYSKLLSEAKFQKGCINFKNEEQVPLGIVKKLMTDCSKIDMSALMEKYKKSKAKQ